MKHELFQGLGGGLKDVCFLQVKSFAELMWISKIFLAMSVLRFQLKITTHPYALGLKLLVTEEKNRV